MEIDRSILDRLSSALVRLSTAASANWGADCYTHTALAQDFLKVLGIKTTLVIGFAAWRVGPGDGDVIVHAPLKGVKVSPSRLPYHAWLETEDRILDFTTYQLVGKAKQLDEIDGGHTTVDWHPDYLYVPKTEVSPFEVVTQEEVGMFHYGQAKGLEALVISKSHPVDEDDMASLWMLYHNPDCQVIGPRTRSMTL